MGDNSGTINKVTINRTTYDVPGDVNATFNRSSFETEGIPTSGKTVHKMTRRVPTIEGLILMTNPTEVETLNAVAESIASFPISLELADGTTYRTTGKVNYENWETEENRSAVQIIPDRTKNAWTPFIA